MASKSFKKPYSLQEAREDVRRLLSSQGPIAFDEFAFVFRMKYGHDLRAESFGCMNLQQLFEKQMRELVKIGGGESVILCCGRWHVIQAVPLGGVPYVETKPV